MTDHAAIWAKAIAKAVIVRPEPVEFHLRDPGASSLLRAATYDSSGAGDLHDPTVPDDLQGRTIHSDPTGQAATARRRGDPDIDIQGSLRGVNRASLSFVGAANRVLGYVAGKTGDSWGECVAIALNIQDGTVAAALDLSDRHHGDPDILDYAELGGSIGRVHRAVQSVETIALRVGIVPRKPSAIDRGRTTKLPDSACCIVHLAVHSAYRHMRVSGTSLCAECIQLIAAARGDIPTPEVIDALERRDDEPEAWCRVRDEWLAA